MTVDHQVLINQQTVLQIKRQALILLLKIICLRMPVSITRILLILVQIRILVILIIEIHHLILMLIIQSFFQIIYHCLTIRIPLIITITIPIAIKVLLNYFRGLRLQDYGDPPILHLHQHQILQTIAEIPVVIREMDLVLLDFY